jgi:hypothetical protein
MDLSLPALSASYQPLLMLHLHRVRLRVMGFELGQVTVVRKATGESWPKRALGLTAIDLDKPGDARRLSLNYQFVIDTLLPYLTRAEGAPVDVTLSSFGYRARLTFTVEVN